MNWGVLYFMYSVLLVPLAQNFAEPRWLVAGAFSLGLLVSAITAPAIGRLADRGQGPAVIQAGGLSAAALLIVWAAAPHIVTTYLVWALLGVCMSAILYEPVFAIVGRAFSDAADRMRAIATVTVMGGLASSIFIPGTAALVNWWGWRGAVMSIGALMALATIVVGRIAFSDLDWSARTIREALRAGHPQEKASVDLRGLNRLVVVFAISAVVNSAIASNLVAALIEGGFAPTLAATVAGLFGWMQLPGRLLMTSPRFTPSPIGLVVFSFALQVAGLTALMVHAHAALVGGVVIFAAGAGLTTLARPYWVLQQYGAPHAGVANGVIARAQQLARAAGPVSAAALAESRGYGLVFALLSGLLVFASFVTIQRPKRHRAVRDE